MLAWVWRPDVGDRRFCYWPSRHILLLWDKSDYLARRDPSLVHDEDWSARLISAKSEKMTGTVKDYKKLRIVEAFEFSKSTKVDVICRVDSLRNTIDRMRHRKASSQRRPIFHIIDPKLPLAWEHSNGEYSKELVCNISTTRVIISKATSGTYNHTLKLAIICVRISFPGFECRYLYGSVRI
jgi:hypothetical protein